MRTLEDYEIEGVALIRAECPEVACLSDNAVAGLYAQWSADEWDAGWLSMDFGLPYNFKIWLRTSAERTHAPRY